jgi:SagB-type dehydrogenase family enzyme
MIVSCLIMSPQSPGTEEGKFVVTLPAPRREGGPALESVLERRRSIREYSGEPLSLEEVSQILWAAQGVTDGDGGRTAPSAGALYPLEVYLVAGNVASLDAGVYHYRPGDHVVVRLVRADVRKGLARAALRQESLRDCAAVVVFAAVYARTRKKYGGRSTRYVHMEVGHAAQNVCLQAVALGLGAVTIGAFDDDAVHGALGLPSGEKVLYLLPVGKPE